MRQRFLLSSLGIPLALMSYLCMAVTPAQHTTGFRRADVCSTLSDPKFFLNKEISLRGPVFVGRDGANIRDKRCPGQGLDLSVETARYRQADIVSFFHKVRSFGGHGTATIVGELVATNSPLTPYSLSIHKVSNVTRSTN